ncbi:MAG TPA: SMP-30/gluconolactonase/LRE family protein [Burkholderiaceae bacterium]|nr:SMP-30/gluconolactonase/LRE family protein [Burkholderiaceae bacterium]
MARKLDVPVTALADTTCVLGESPVWSERESILYWADIVAATVHGLDPADGSRRRWQLPAAVGSLGLREQGGLVLALRSGFHLFDTTTGALTFLANPEADVPTNRLNDGKVSPEGRFWAGSMDDRPQREPTGHLYRLDADHRCTRMASGIRVSNGLAWSPDGRTMFHADSRAPAIYCYDYDPDSGALRNRRLFADAQPESGRPDGGAVDADGCYWSCGIGAGRINRYAPGGELIAYVELPVTHPTMPCFGGPGLRTLYCTSLRDGLAADVLARTPLAGSVFRIDAGIPGTAIGLYRG